LLQRIILGLPRSAGQSRKAQPSRTVRARSSDA